MVSKEQIKALALAYTRMAEAEEVLEVESTTFQVLADKFMGDMQARPENEGKMWERDEPFHLTCSDCQVSAGLLAVKIIEGWKEDE
jgi:hypothetical protein